MIRITLAIFLAMQINISFAQSNWFAKQTVDQMTDATQCNPFIKLQNQPINFMFIKTFEKNELYLYLTIPRKEMINFKDKLALNVRIDKNTFREKNLFGDGYKTGSTAFFIDGEFLNELKKGNTLLIDLGKKYLKVPLKGITKAMEVCKFI